MQIAAAVNVTISYHLGKECVILHRHLKRRRLYILFQREAMQLDAELM